MQILKLVLIAAAVLIAGQALAHRGLRAIAAPASGARLAPAQTDTNPTALLGGIAGRSAPETNAMPLMSHQAAPAKGIETSTHITRRH